jgi:hypothetical protein
MDSTGRLAEAVMATLAHRSGLRWWMYVIASVYLLTLGFNAWVEFFAAANPGLQYTVTESSTAWPSFEIESVEPGSPLEHAGARAGDVIESIDQHRIVGQTDWFVARSSLEPDRPTAMQVRRGAERLHLTFTITKRNWQTFGAGTVAFQSTRGLILLVALVIAFRRPEQVSALLGAWLFAMIAVAEGFPPSGWTAALRHWPPFLSIPIMLASVSWLLITVPWLSLSLLFPRPRVASRSIWVVVLAPLAIFAPLIITSAVALIYEPRWLAMPLPFLDAQMTLTQLTRNLRGVWGMTPTLFINPWPWYEPARQAKLLDLWTAVTLLFLTAGYVNFVVASVRERDGVERRRLRVVVFALAMFLVIGADNVLLRNWPGIFGTTTPALFWTMGLVFEIAGFLLSATVLAYSLLKHRDSLNDAAARAPDRESA